VVDAAQAETLPRCRDMLHQSLSHADLAGLPLLVLSNKMDLPEALQPAEVAAALDLTALRDRAIHIAGCSALQNTGVQVRGADGLGH
jgi:signal recognition particle receptor subunit beta